MEIMQTAAKEIAGSTEERIIGNVFTINPGGSDLFRYTFYLVAPSLDDYTDPLFYAWHGTQSYPIHVLPAGGKQGKDEKKCQSPDEFEQALSNIFQSQSAQERIYTMLDAISAL